MSKEVQALHLLIGYLHLDLAGARMMKKEERRLVEDLVEWMERRRG